MDGLQAFKLANIVLERAVESVTRKIQLCIPHIVPKSGACGPISVVSYQRLKKLKL